MPAGRKTFDSRSSFAIDGLLPTRSVSRHRWVVDDAVPVASPDRQEESCVGAVEPDRMAWPDVRPQIERGRATVVVAFGAIEQHTLKAVEEP